MDTSSSSSSSSSSLLLLQSIINPSIMIMDNNNNTTSHDITNNMPIIGDNKEEEEGSTRSSSTSFIPHNKNNKNNNNNNNTIKVMDKHNIISTTTTSSRRARIGIDEDKRKHSNRFFAKHHAKWNRIDDGRWIREEDVKKEEDNDDVMNYDTHYETTLNRLSDNIKYDDETTSMKKCSLPLPPTTRRAVINRINNDNNMMKSQQEDILIYNYPTCRSSRSSSGGSNRSPTIKHLSSITSKDYYETPLNAVMIKDMSSPNLLRWRWTGDFEACPPYLGEENHPLHDMQYSPFIDNDRQWMRILRKAPKFNSDRLLLRRRRSSLASRRSSISSSSAAGGGGGSFSDCEADTYEECAHLDEVMDSLCYQSDPECDTWSSTRYCDDNNKAKNDDDDHHRIRRRSSLHRNRRHRLSRNKM